MKPEVKARLGALLARVQQLRRNLYPADWDTDPLRQIEEGLQRICDAEK